MSNMVRVIEYINKKRYRRDTKTGKQWRLQEPKLKEQREGRKKRKEKDPGEEKVRIQTRHSGPEKN